MKKRNLDSNKINYPYSYKKSNLLFSITFLGLIIDYKQVLEINSKNGLRRNSLIVRIGYTESILSEVHEYQYYYTGSEYQNSVSCTDKSIIDLWVNMFGFGPKAILTLKSCLYNSISIDIINNQMITTGFTSHEISLNADLKLDFFVISSGVKITNKFIKGDSYIQAKSIENSEKSEFLFYKSFRFNSIYLEIYFSRWNIFWEKKYSKTFYLFSGSNIYYKNTYYY